MTPQEEMQTVDNILIFMRRANLTGEEVLAFNQGMTYLIQKRETLAKAGESMQKSLDLTEAED